MAAAISAASTLQRNTNARGSKLKTLLKRVWHDDNGQDIAEYALMLTVILLIVVATVSSIGTSANSIFDKVANQLASV